MNFINYSEWLFSLINFIDYGLFRSHGVTTLISSVSDEQNILDKSQRNQDTGLELCSEILRRPSLVGILFKQLLLELSHPVLALL